MKLEDAPPAGWYPDPERGGRLRWWEGTDWTDQRRAPPNAAEIQSALSVTSEAASSATATARPDGVRLRSSDTEQIVSQVRDVTRDEFSRAGEMLSRRARATFEQSQSVVAEYFGVVLRWTKITVVVAAVLVVAWFVLQFVAQATLLEWLGDRIDNITDG